MPAPEVQIAGAVQAAPADQRESATVIGFDAQGKHTTLRKGTGILVCLADDPREDKFSVACYHKDLEPFMARGRELAALGTEGTWPRGPALEGDPGRHPGHAEGAAAHYDRAGQRVRRRDRHSWQTATPAGSSTRPARRPNPPACRLTPGPGAPWLMFPGTPGAHIMISPARPK